MSEIAKCPLCGKDVKKSIWRPEYEGCAGNVVITVKCCGMEALTVELWNQYAAAMELAKAKHQRESIRRNVFGDWDEYDENLLQAERRVLEIFK